MPGFWRPNSWAWLIWTQLASMLSAVVDLGADPELGLEQHAAAEVDLVVGQVLEFSRRAGVDRNAEAGPDVDPLAELRRHADRGVVVSPAVLSAPKI